MNTNLIAKISKRLSEIIKNIKDCNKNYEETKDQSWRDVKRKYMLELALNFANLEHEFDHRILYRFKKENLQVLNNICHKCMTLHKIESTEESNIKAFDIKNENLTLDMIDNIDNSLPDLENGINKVLEDYPITTDKVKSVLDKDKKETKNPPVGNLVKQIYDITNRIEYYENKYAQTQDEFFKEMEKNSVYELALELKKFEDIRNSDVAKTLSKENLEKLDEYIHFSNKLINLRNEIEQTKTDEDFNQKDAANDLRSMIETETKNQSLELE